MLINSFIPITILPPPYLHTGLRTPPPEGDTRSLNIRRVICYIPEQFPPSEGVRGRTFHIQ